MRAWVLHGINDLRFETVKEPDIGEEEVLVEVKAAGICGSDIPRIYDTGAHMHPLIPGHEFSGVVESIGASVDSGWLGQRVGVYPLIPCRKCLPCWSEKYEMCRDYSYLGSRRDGGFAEYVAVPARNLIKLPDTVSFEEAAMLEPMAVAIHALKRIHAAKTDTVTVCGLGTIGLLMVNFLLAIREKGIKGIEAKRIYVIGNKEIQRQIILKMGLHEDSYCDCRVQTAGPWLMEKTEGAGVNIFFECVGKNESFTLAVESTAPAGEICLVGNPQSDMTLEKAAYWKILRKQLSVTGTWNSSFEGKADDDWHEVLALLAERKIAPCNLITKIYSLEGLGQGFQMMRDKTEDYVKVIGVFS